MGAFLDTQDHHADKSTDTMNEMILRDTTKV